MAYGFWLKRKTKVNNKNNKKHVLVVKNLLANAGDIRDVDLITELGRYPEEGHKNPFQYSCLENPMDIGSWWATIYGVAESWT